MPGRKRFVRNEHEPGNWLRKPKVHLEKSTINHLPPRKKKGDVTQEKKQKKKTLQSQTQGTQELRIRPAGRPEGT